MIIEIKDTDVDMFRLCTVLCTKGINLTWEDTTRLSGSIININLAKEFFKENNINYV